MKFMGFIVFAVMAVLLSPSLAAPTSTLNTVTAKAVDWKAVAWKALFIASELADSKRARSLWRKPEWP